MVKNTVIVLAAIVLLGTGVALAANGGGFNEFGYNYSARIFNGTCISWGQGKYGWTKTEAESYCGIYANDKLVMKWNAAWDACNSDQNACAGAWVDNEWNGNVPGGSETTEHYKIVWIDSSCGADYTSLPNGGYCIWGHYEVIMDQGTDSTGHFWLARGIPNGYGTVFSQ